MGLIVELATKPPLSAQRLRTFTAFVKNNKGGKGMYLHSDGLEEWYAPAVFDNGLYNRCRILLGDKCVTIARFNSMKEANGYAATLMMVLRGNGFARSRVRGEQVYLRGTVFTNWALGTRSQMVLSETPTYVIRMDVKK